jgi:sigma-B regulation protein RsbU (phosphoserine phosphatase)
LEKHKILIVDDNPDMIYLIKKRFEKEAYSFIEAYDGEEGVRKARREKPDLILLDLKMPKKYGMDVLKEIRSDYELKEIPVIVLTVVDDESEKISALEIGANDFLVKPPEPAELRARVGTQLELLKATRIFKKYSLHLENIVSKKMRELRDYANQLEERVEEKVGVIRTQNEELLISLNSARKVQKSLLPPENYTVKDVEFSSFYYPCDAIGGDIYDIFRIDEDKVGIFIADVSGHGLPSAMITIFLKGEVSHHVKQVLGGGKYTVVSPAEVLRNINQSFIENNIGEGRYFVTMVYGVYSLGEKILTLSVAGHHALPVVKRKTGETEAVKMGGFPVGWFEDVGEYEETDVRLFSGDTVFFYTDGVFELLEEKGQSLSHEDLTFPVTELLKRGNAVELLQKRMKKDRAQNKRPKDDVTFLLMKIG